MASLTEGRRGGKVPPKLLLSLRGVPPKCVFPHRVSKGGFSASEEEARLNPFGDPELGSLSSYCVCLGDASGMNSDDVPVHFVGKDTELTLALAPTTRPQRGDGYTVEEMEVSVRAGRPYFQKSCSWGRPSSALVGTYCRLTWRSPLVAAGDASNENGMRGGGAEEHRGDERPAAGNGRSNGSAAGPEDDPDEGVNLPSDGPRNGDPAVVPRPPHLATLSSLRSRVGLNAVLYGIVLGFSSPSRTASGQFKMSIVLVDETLPLPSAGSGAGAPPGGDVPSVTLVVFSRRPEGLPGVRSAGDVVYLERIKVQEWQGNVQLAAYSNRSPVVAVARPVPAAVVVGAGGSGRWTASAPDGAPLPPGFDEALASKLHEWGLRRLSSHPTVSGRCAATLSSLNENATSGESAVASGGDLTVVVTGIVETPEEMRRRDSPRGYLRVWDGTGPSRSDP